MPTLQCKDYPIRSVIIDGKRLNALLIASRKGVIRCEGLPVELEFFTLLVDKKITYCAFKPDDFLTYCKSAKRAMGVSEKNLKRVDRRGDLMLIASARYHNLTRNWSDVNTGEDDGPLSQ